MFKFFADCRYRRELLALYASLLPARLKQFEDGGQGAPRTWHDAETLAWSDAAAARATFDKMTKSALLND